MLTFMKTVDKKMQMLLVTLLSIIIFSILYSFCDDEEFTSWIGSYYKAPTPRLMYLTDLFDKLAGDVPVAKSDEKMISRKRFVEIPIFKGEGDGIYILKKHNDISLGSDAVRLRENIFDIMDERETEMLGTVRGHIKRSTFVGIPVDMKYIGDYVSPHIKKLDYTEIAADKHYRFGFVDRLYFSIITQSTIGFGDVVPASTRVRLLAGLQALCTLIIVSVH